MANASQWDATKIKAQMRMCAQRLGQLQDKKDSQGQITRRDIATLLQQEQVALARAKAQKLAREDALEVLLQVLEMHIGVVLEHLGELESQQPPSPSLVEAASSIIYAAHHFEESKDLIGVSQVLAQRLGPDFTRSAIGNRDAYVAPQVIGALSAPPPSAARLDDYMVTIAKAYGVEWKPALRPHERLNALSELLSPDSPAPIIDMPRLRALCDLGIPGHPPWLRPRIWRLCFGTLPILKSSWADEAEKQRASYYDLVRRLLEPFAQLPSTSTPLAPLDISLLDTSKELSRVPPSLFSELEDEPEASHLCPLHPSSPDYISCASGLDSRLAVILASSENRSGPMPTPEIRLEELPETPEISLTEPLSPTVEKAAASRSSLPTTLHPSKTLGSLAAHPQHHSALLRLLYIHSSLNPASRSPHVASIMVPLYSVLVQEIEQADVAHAEADTFWLFEAIISEFAELEEEEGGRVTLQRFGERVAWADEELFGNLHTKGLDPAMPHYSYRWLAPLLAHTLPLPSVFAVWDAVFSREPRTRAANPRLDYLLDICASMLIRARGPLFRLGKSGRRSPGLWGEVDNSMPPPSPLRPWELGDAFLEGMSLLQAYNVEAAGGIESILQTGADLSHRRLMESKRDQGPNLGIGARLRDTMWRGFTNKVPDIEEEEEEETSDESSSEEETSQGEGNATEPAAPGLTTRWASSVWKGITNQSAMEAPPTPISPSYHSPLSPIPPPSAASNASSRLSIWDYTAKLKDSDSAAALAKVSSNWRAKALTAWGTGAASVPSSSVSEPPTSPATRRDSLWQNAGIPRHESLGQWPNNHGRSESMDQVQTQAYSPPPKPAFFRAPRDSWMPSPHSRRASNSSAASNDTNSPQEGSLLDKAKALQDSLTALTGLQMPAPKAAPKAGPRPLLLNSSTLLTGHTRTPSVSRGHTPTPSIPSISRVPSDSAVHLRRDSQSSASASSVGPSNRESLFSVAPSNRESISSLAPSARESWDSDKRSSRVVPLRRSRSPMAPTFAAARVRTSGSERSPVGSDGHLSTGSEAATISRRSRSSDGWGQVDASESLEQVGNGHSRTGSGSSKVTIVREDGSMTSDSSVAGIPMPKSPRGLRGKRNFNRPTNIRTGLGTETLVAPENPEAEDAVTPRAAQFEDSPGSSTATSPEAVEVSRSPRRRKLSSNSRKTGSGEARTRKVSGGSMHRPRDSEAENGDDEGYDDLLSAYESEDGTKATR